MRQIIGELDKLRIVEWLQHLKHDRLDACRAPLL
jgi:hypothetical protein